MYSFPLIVSHLNTALEESWNLFSKPRVSHICFAYTSSHSEGNLRKQCKLILFQSPGSHICQLFLSRIREISWRSPVSADRQWRLWMLCGRDRSYGILEKVCFPSQRFQPRENDIVKDSSLQVHPYSIPLREVSSIGQLLSVPVTPTLNLQLEACKRSGHIPSFRLSL